MQKSRIFIALMLFQSLHIVGQGFNMVKKAQIKIPNQFYTDIWGYERSNGDKFAIVGTRQKTVIYNVTECGNPIEVFQHTDGFTSAWRDYKTYGNAIYATADQSPYNQGLQIFNMDNYTVTTINNKFARAHNLYVDTINARLYIAGSNSVNRGLIVYDVSNPLSPVHLKDIHIDSLVGAPGLYTYVHDVYVKNNIAYTSNGGIRKMYQLDVSNLQNVQVLSTYEGPNGYNHSSWTTDDETYIYEALEVPRGMPINIYKRNIDNPSLLELISTFKHPLELSPDNRPHNPFIHENKLYISYYEDGVQVYDLANPVSPKRIAYYDTYPDNNGYGYDSNFYGCWGVYPFLSSGCILANDINHGFYTLELDLPQENWNSNVISNHNIYQDLVGRGIVLRSPNGNCFLVGANNVGNFTLTRVHCNSNAIAEEYVIKADIAIPLKDRSIISRNINDVCYQMKVNSSNQIISEMITCPSILDPQVRIQDNNLIVDTPTKGIVLLNSGTGACVRIQATDSGAFLVTNLASCP